MWYFIVSIPDLCTLTYFNSLNYLQGVSRNRYIPFAQFYTSNLPLQIPVIKNIQILYFVVNYGGKRGLYFGPKYFLSLYKPQMEYFQTSRHNKSCLGYGDLAIF